MLKKFILFFHSVLFAIILSLFVAGCGGSSNDSGYTPGEDSDQTIWGSAIWGKSTWSK